MLYLDKGRAEMPFYYEQNLATFYIAKCYFDKNDAYQSFIDDLSRFILISRYFVIEFVSIT